MRKSLLPIIIFSLLFIWSGIQAQTVTNFYSSGHIPTSFEMFDPSCNGPGTTIPIQLPPGGPWEVTGIDIQYNMTPATILGSLYQRSRIYCQNTDQQEPVIIGPAVIGTAVYDRSNVNIANGVYAGGTNLIFEMRAWRILEGSGCSILHNRVDNNTWVITVHYQLLEDFCMPPDSVSLVEVTGTSAMFTWAGVPEAMFGYAWLIMLANQNPDSDTPVSAGIAAAGTTELEISGLSPNIAYDFYIQSLCEDGNSAWSIAVSFITEEQLCESPGGLTVDEVSGTMVVVSWDEPGNTEDILMYEWGLVLSGDDPDLEEGLVYTGLLPAGTSMHSITDLEYATTYDFYIKSICTGEEESDWEGPLTFITDNEGCEQPANVNIEVVSAFEIAVDWTEPVNINNVSGYNWLIVLENQDPTDEEAWVQQGIIPVGNSNLFISNLEAATIYDFYIKSVCEGDNESDWVGALTFITHEFDCEAPTGLVINSTTETEATISWSEPSNTENIVGYVWIVVLAGDNPLNESEVVYIGGLPVGTTTHSVENLLSGTLYDFYLLSVCSGEIQSNLVSITFMTDVLNRADEITPGFSVYPNPANESIMIEHIGIEPIGVKVLDVYGRCLYRLTLVDKPIIIDLTQYPAGVYFLNVKSEESIQTHPFIIHR